MVTPDRNIRVRRHDSSSYTSPEETTELEKPEGLPKGDKDFSRILDTGVSDQRKRHAIVTEEEQEGGTMGSIFELSKKKSKEKMKDVEDQPQVNLNALASGAASPSSAEVSEEQSEELEDALSKREKFGTPLQFTQEQPDMSGVVPFTAALDASSIASAASSLVEDVKPPNDLQEIIDQIVNNMYTLSTGGVTDTTFTLKNMPMFENVDVTLTTYKTAPHQFNLTISNLTQAAKNMLDMNLGSLQNSLGQKNIVLHMITTTTVELPIAQQTAQSDAFKRGSREQEGGGAGQSKKEQKK